MADFRIETERLILRGWRDHDRAAFAAINRDPEVMRYLNGPIDAAASDAMIDRQIAGQAASGHCLWAVERRDDARLLGYCGLRVGGPPGTGVADELEIGWRFARAAWGQGYAREAAAASLAWGFANTDRARIAAWTVPANTASWGLMRRLGMTARPGLDFAHPKFAADHPLSRHIVYVIERSA
jgi:RimJ/RimL family protein N-acetyltransferase